MREVDVRVGEARPDEREAADLVSRVPCQLDDARSERVVRDRKAIGCSCS
jgi:hypothetical protein